MSPSVIGAKVRMSGSAPRRLCLSTRMLARIKAPGPSRDSPLKLSLSGNLWHHRDFTRLWFSETVSSAGSQFSTFAIPVLAILSFHANSFEYGVLVALGFLP